MRIALVDGDIINWKFALKAEVKHEFAPGLWCWWASADEAEVFAEEFINRLMQDVKADEAFLYFSSSTNFRKTLNESYKSNRKDRYSPLVLEELRSRLEKSWRTQVIPGIEADDAIGVMATSQTQHEMIVCSIDKDFLQLPGIKLWNWDKPELGVQTVDPVEAEKWFYIQAISGDAVDGYGGCPSIGIKRATDLVEKHWPDVWPEIVKAYAKQGLDEDYAVLMARMARILRAGEYDAAAEAPVLWSPSDG